MKSLDIILASTSVISLIYLILKKRRKRWVSRRWWTRPINLRRNISGDFNHLFQELKEDETMFFKYTRMDMPTFNHLLSQVSPFLQKHSKRESLPPEFQLAVTLRFLATGDQVTSLALAYRIGISTCYNIIKETCEVLGRILSPIYLTPPDEEEFKTVAAGFLEKWNIPNCIGAIDGKHIVIQCPCNTGSEYFNYKKTFSVVLMGICDSSYKFFLIDIGAPRSFSDGAIFSWSLGEALQRGDLNIPEGNAILPGTDIKLPYFFVGDSAFQLTTHLMRPYPGRFLDDIRAVFNYRLSRGKRLIENTFGILAARWRVFRKPISMNEDAAKKLILAAVCLHNFLIMKNERRPMCQQIYCPPTFIDRIEGEWRQEGHSIFGNSPFNAPHRATRTAYQQRDILAAYFCTPQGEVPWQMEYIRRGNYQN